MVPFWNNLRAICCWWISVTQSGHCGHSEKVSKMNSSQSSLVPAGLFQAVRTQQPLNCQDTTHLTLISMSQSVSLCVPHKQEFLRDCAFQVFALSLHSKPPAQCLDPAEPLGVLEMLGVGGWDLWMHLLSQGAPYNPSMRRAWDGKGQKRPVPGRPIRQLGDKYLSSIRGQRQLLPPIFKKK